MVTFSDPVIFTLPLIFTLLSENTSNMAKLPVLTENNEPEIESSIVNILPNIPSTVNNPDPLPCIDVDPVTTRDPVILAEPVYGKGDTYPLRYDAVDE